MSKKIKVKLKKVKVTKFTLKSLDEKCTEMYNALHITQAMGNEAVKVLTAEIHKTQKPVVELAERAADFFYGKMRDKHAPALLSVFGLLFSRILFDPTVNCVTVAEKKGDDDSGQKDTGKDSK